MLFCFQTSLGKNLPRVKHDVAASRLLWLNPCRSIDEHCKDIAVLRLAICIASDSAGIYEHFINETMSFVLLPKIRL